MWDLGRAGAWQTLCSGVHSFVTCFLPRSPRGLARLSRAGLTVLMPKKITVLLVDDHALVRRGFRRILDDESSIAVVGEAGDGVRAVEMVRDLKPRVVLMDCSMPGGDGLTATREIVNSHAKTAVLMLSMHSEKSLIERAIEAGARGYILKNAFELDLVPAIKRAVAGEFVLDQHIVNPPATPGKRPSPLTKRELEVLQLIVDGKSTREIALALGLSVNTISAHRTRISRTLNIHNAAELVAYAIRNGLVRIP